MRQFKCLVSGKFGHHQRQAGDLLTEGDYLPEQFEFWLRRGVVADMPTNNTAALNAEIERLQAFETEFVVLLAENKALTASVVELLAENKALTASVVELEATLARTHEELAQALTAKPELVADLAKPTAAAEAALEAIGIETELLPSPPPTSGKRRS